MPEDILKLIEKASQKCLEEQPRSHLGASVLGKRCMREVWYTFRWAYHVKHTGRMLRLFNRGHLEEERVARWLRAAGFELRAHNKRLVQCYDEGGGSEVFYKLLPWDQPLAYDEADVSDNPHHIAIAIEQGVPVEQWGFTDHEKHFAGHCDGKLRFPPELKRPDTWGLFECKTHKEKSFKDMKAKGVLTSKLTHYVQAQIYMHYLKLPWCLYVAVNKDTDEIYTEILVYKEELALQYVDQAAKIIGMQTPPPRISNDRSWWECKFCDFREICHHGEPMQRNCRSCVNAKPGENGSWYCTRYHNTIPEDFIPTGCGNWEEIG